MLLLMVLVSETNGSISLTIRFSITAAGIAKEKPFLEQTPADVTSLLNVNVRESSRLTALKWAPNSSKF
jgi:hypothetical protein